MYDDGIMNARMTGLPGMGNFEKWPSRDSDIELRYVS